MTDEQKIDIRNILGALIIVDKSLQDLIGQLGGPDKIDNAELVQQQKYLYGVVIELSEMI